MNLADFGEIVKNTENFRNLWRDYQRLHPSTDGRWSSDFLAGLCIAILDKLDKMPDRTIDSTFVHDIAIGLFDWIKNYLPEHIHEQALEYIQDGMERVAYNEKKSS